MKEKIESSLSKSAIGESTLDMKLDDLFVAMFPRAELEAFRRIDIMGRFQILILSARASREKSESLDRCYRHLRKELDRVSQVSLFEKKISIA
jgi:hypothetical protein